jgi:hypothetical protein
MANHIINCSDLSQDVLACWVRMGFVESIP